jgi:hypothetical protein
MRAPLFTSKQKKEKKNKKQKQPVPRADKIPVVKYSAIYEESKNIL